MKTIPDYKKITFMSSMTLIMFLVLILLVILVPRIFGSTPYIIEDKKISPYYVQGNLIYIRPKNTNEILAGDTITYCKNPGKKISAHRVIVVESNHEDLYIKADIKAYIGSGVTKEGNIIGSPIFQTSYIGLVLSEAAFVWVQGLSFTIAFCLAGITAWNTFAELKKKRRRTQKFL